MSRRTIRVIDLMCRAINWQGSIDRNSDDDLEEPYKAVVEDEVRRWSQKRDAVVAKLRRLVDQLDERERQLLIKHNHDLDVSMRGIGVELPWWIGGEHKK